MKRVLRFLGYCLLSLVGLLALCGSLFGYFVYSPEPAVPPLSGTLNKGAMQVGGLKRTYLSYVPRGLPKGAPLVLVMHGSGQDGAQIRIETGYGFERLADQHGFAVVYPDSYTFDWDDCSKVGDFSVNGHDVDDVGFLDAVADRLITDIGADPRRVFATGVSAGGFMAIRLALESPARFRAVAAVSANVQTPENFKCTPTGRGASVMIMNGTKDPLVPFAGGQSSLFGLFFKNGNVRSSRDSGQYFADLNKLAGTPVANRSARSDGAGVALLDWHQDAKVEVELVAVQGGGHGMPQPYWRRPRLLGPSPMNPNGPAMIWDFFARQQP
jgi:polyhydroxybutyrate depolymerase